MLAAVRSATVFGVEGRAVTVEVHVSTGLPAFQIVGLPDEACRESRDRVRAAVLSSNLKWPSCRVTVNLAPTNQRKGGSGLDLAIAVAFLAASEQVPVAALAGLGMVGELGLDGSLRPVSGVAPMLAAICTEAGAHGVGGAGGAGGDVVRPVVPAASFREAQGVVGDAARVATCLAEVVAAPAIPGPPARARSVHVVAVARWCTPQRGCACPGGLVRRAPFRAPHHSSSMVSLVGGGSTSLRPGEISLSHGGVLFLDELGEFAPVVLDGLRQPLEEGDPPGGRASALPCPLPACATNPCQAAAANQASAVRRCRPAALPAPPLRPLARPLRPARGGRAAGGRRSARGRRRRAHRARGAAGGGCPSDGARTHRHAQRRNPTVPARRARAPAPRSPPQAGEELEADTLTGRGYHRVRRVARTIADLLDGDELVTEAHVTLALQMRVRMSVTSRRRAA
jgi:magnesium chelatase family protein